jgi:LPXTG-motif cell wall-anchored protein
MPLTGDIELDIYGNQDWASNNLNNVSVDGAVDDSKELRLDDTFPSEAEKAKATQELTADHPMHAWSFGIGDAFDFPSGDELGQYLYYVVELNDQGEDVAIGGNVDEDMKLLFIEYNPAMTDGKGITHGLITVTNEVTVAQPTTVDITILKVDNDNNSIKLGGATFELTKVQSLETSNQVSDDGYSERGTTSDADDETKGKLLFTGLTPGYYYLHETKSPDGYVITTNGWHFQVDENGIVSGVGDFDPDGFFRYVDENNITVTNQKGAALPNTGGPGTWFFTLLGGLLMTGAVVLLWKRQRLV